MLLWMDGADHYGGDEELLTQGVYADAVGVQLATDNPRTGTYHFRIAGGNNDKGLRRVFGADLEEAAVGYAFYIPELPGDSESLVLAGFADNDLEYQATFVLTSTGQVRLVKGEEDAPSGEAILGTSAPVIVARSYQHIELFLKVGQADGEAEVRVNGVTVLALSGIDTLMHDSGIIAQVKVGTIGTVNIGFPPYMDVDDLFAWDTSGTQNNDFIGDKKVYTVFPNADGADEEWTPSTGANSYAMLDNVPPLDDTEYLTAENPNLTSSFALGNLPAEVVAIAGVMTALRARKTDAGNAKVQVSMESNAASDVGADHAISQAFTYYHDVFEVDPDTDAPWAVAAFNAAGAAIERTE